MDPVSKFFKAVLEEFNNLKNGVSYVWYDSFKLDDCKYQVSQFFFRHPRCLYIGHGYYFIPNMAKEPVFVFIGSSGVRISSKNAMKDILEEEQDFINRLKEAIENADELS